MEKKDSDDKTIKMVAKILENQNLLWSLFVQGVKIFSAMPGKTKMNEFEKIEISPISISEFLEIYKLNFLFTVGKKAESVTFSKESLKKAEKFIEKMASAIETLNKNYEFMWNICLLSNLHNLVKKKKFKDVTTTMQNQIDLFLQNYKNFNQIAMEMKIFNISNVFKAFKNFEINFKNDEENTVVCFIFLLMGCQMKKVL